MDRRHLLAGLVVMAASPAFAQQSTGVGASDEQMGQAEQRHAAETLAAGAVALEMSRIAMEKAQDEWVKKFAQYEVAEQDTMAEVLTSLGAQPAKMTDQQNRMMQGMIKRLKGAQAGPRFDREYIEAQIEGHQELLKIQENYLASGKVRSHVNVTKLARGQIKEHLDMVQTIRNGLKS